MLSIWSSLKFCLLVKSKAVFHKSFAEAFGFGSPKFVALPWWLSGEHVKLMTWGVVSLRPG